MVADLGRLVGLTPLTLATRTGSVQVQGGGVGRLGRPWRDVERVPLDELLAALGVEDAAPPDEALLTVWLAPGPWKPPVTLARRGVVLFVLSGALLRSRRDAIERRVDLLLAGDAIRMTGEDGALWRALPAQQVRRAVVGPHTVKALAGVPGAANALMHALLQQLELELELRAVVGIQRIEQRIVAFFALLARRLGEDVPGGVRIPLPLEQKRIEEILSAGHTQATMAFRALFAAGVLIHDAAGWRFDPSSVPFSSTGSLRAVSAR
jgi:hypothetical protein